MRKTMGLFGALMVWMAGCGPADTETEQSPTVGQEMQRTAETRQDQAYSIWYYADPEMTQLIGYFDGCDPDYSWGDTSGTGFEMSRLIWCEVR